MLLKTGMKRSIWHRRAVKEACCYRSFLLEPIAIFFLIGVHANIFRGGSWAANQRRCRRNSEPKCIQIQSLKSLSENSKISFYKLHDLHYLYFYKPLENHLLFSFKKIQDIL